MDAGRCIEFGTPYELLTAQDGPRIFYGMVKQTGKSTYDSLLKIAKEVCFLVGFIWSINNWILFLQTHEKKHRTDAEPAAS